jgi:hypothetical protein
LVEEAGDFLAGAASNLDEKPWAVAILTPMFLFTDIRCGHWGHRRC